VAPAPGLFTVCRVEGAHITVHVLYVDLDAGPPVRDALLELSATPRGGRPDLLHRDVEELRPRAVGRVRPLLATGRPRPEMNRLPLLVRVNLRRDRPIRADLAPGDPVDKGSNPHQLAVG